MKIIRKIIQRLKTRKLVTEFEIYTIENKVQNFIKSVNKILK